MLLVIAGIVGFAAFLLLTAYAPELRSGRDGRVLAGKQISPNLYLQYAYGVFDQLSTVLLRLKLNERLSLESSTGEDQSVDLIYSVGRN